MAKKIQETLMGQSSYSRGPNFVPYRAAAFFIFRTIINFLKSVYVPYRDPYKILKAIRTVENAFVFPFVL